MAKDTKIGTQHAYTYCTKTCNLKFGMYIYMVYMWQNILGGM